VDANKVMNEVLKTAINHDIFKKLIPITIFNVPYQNIQAVSDMMQEEDFIKRY
jgi:sporulation protein YlmC with PRC-barrel domain